VRFIKRKARSPVYRKSIGANPVVGTGFEIPRGGVRVADRRVTYGIYS